MGECDLGEVARSAYCLCHQARFLGLTPNVSLKLEPRQHLFNLTFTRDRTQVFLFPSHGTAIDLRLLVIKH